jgi:mRNA interferase RelE/StbE
LAWTIEVTPAAARQLRKLDRQAARRIGDYLREVAADCSHPRQRGEGLTANLSGLWRYRVGDYRVICEIAEARLTVLVVRISHRSEVYR